MPRRQSSRRYHESSKAEVNPSKEGQVQRQEAVVFGRPGKGLPLSIQTAAGGRGSLSFLTTSFRFSLFKSLQWSPIVCPNRPKSWAEPSNSGPSTLTDSLPQAAHRVSPLSLKTQKRVTRSPVLPGPVDLPEGHPTQSKAPPRIPTHLCQQYNFSSDCSM